MATDFASMTPEQREHKRRTDNEWRRKNRTRHNETDRKRRMKNPEKERQRKRKQSASRDRFSKHRMCSVCGAAISDRNRSGICAKTPECRTEQQIRRNANRTGGENRKGDPSGLLPPAYELQPEGDEYALDVFGERIEIVDEVAVNRMVEGHSRCAHTLTERKVAMKRMIWIGLQYREIAYHIGTSPDKLKPLFEELGYEIIPRRTPGSRGLSATEIRKRRA